MMLADPERWINLPRTEDNIAVESLRKAQAAEKRKGWISSMAILRIQPFDSERYVYMTFKALSNANHKMPLV